MAGSAVGDTRFFARGGPFTLAEVAACLGIAAPDGAERAMQGVAPLQVAGPGHVSFLDNRRYLPALKQTGAGAVIVHPAMAAHVPAGAAALVTPEPYLGWAKAAALFHPPPPPRPGVHPSAAVDPAAIVDATAELGPLCVVEDGAEIGAGCRIGPGAVIGPGVILGPGCRIGANASISHAVLGARVYIYPGARIGQEGFGFAITAHGFVTVPQLGRVLIGDDVEVGANTCVDRGSAQDTVIGPGTRLDNLVQIAHNVVIGRCCVVAALAGIAGSAVLEDFVMVGGQVGIAGHVRVGQRAKMGAHTGVISDVAPGSELLGSPAMPIKEFFRNVAVLRKLSAERRAAAKAAGDGPTADEARSG